jgi:hypothetical protein
MLKIPPIDASTIRGDRANRARDRPSHPVAVLNAQISDRFRAGSNFLFVSESDAAGDSG